MALFEEMLRIDVRRATLDDIKSVHEITQDSFQIYQRGLNMPAKVAALKETYEDVARDIERKIVFIAAVEGRDDGALRLEICGNIGYISRFGVKANSQGGGLGRYLMLAAVKEAKERGLAALALHTSTRMYSLMAFYYKNDFFVHSVSNDRGYIRGLLLRDICEDAATVDLSPVWEK